MTDSAPSSPERKFDRHDRLQTLNEISRVVSATLDLGTLYDTIYEQVGRVMDTTQFFIALHRPARNSLEVPYLREYGRLSVGLEVEYDDSVTTRVIRSGIPLLFHTSEEFAQYARDNGLPELFVGDEDSESGIFVPLHTGSRAIGALTVQSERDHAYTKDDVQTLSVIASQAAVAIENARLYQQSQDSVRQMQALLHVAQAVNSSLDLRAVLDAILFGMRDVLPYALAGVLLPVRSKGYLRVMGFSGPLAQPDLPDPSVRFGDGVTGMVYQTGEPHIVPNVTDFPGYVAVAPEIRSEMAVPLKRGDSVVGVLDVQRVEIDAFSAEDLGLLSLFASQAAIAIENARLFAEQQNRAHELGVIQSIVSQLTPLHDIPSIAQLINVELKHLIDFHACRVFLLNDADGVLIPLAQPDFDPSGIQLRVGEGITGAIAATGRSELIANTLSDVRGSQIAGTPRRSESMIGAALMVEGRVRGVITLSKLGTHQFDQNALRLLEIIAGQTALACDRARLYDELRTEAVTDELTGLFNRRYLFARYTEEQARAIRNGHPLAAIMLDLDKFKRVNDTFGHEAGDVVLREVAAVVRKIVRTEDIVARYGGEEFCIVLPEIPPADAEHVADRLRVAIAELSLPPEAGVSHITVSVGLSFLLPQDEDLSLFSRADAAMYQGKQLGGNVLCVATPNGYKVA